MIRLCEKLQSHPRGCFGVGYPKRLWSKVTMKEVCRIPASIASWPLRDIYIFKPVTSAKMTGVGNQWYTEGYIKVDNLREMPGKPLISVIHIFPTPVILADVAGLGGSPPKAMMRCLQGRDTPLSWCSYFLTSSDYQPRNSLTGDFVTSHKAYSSVRWDSV